LRATSTITGRARGGAEVLLLAGGQRLAQLCENRRGADQPLDRPGQTGRGRLMPGAEHRHHLVAQFLVAHRLAVLVPRAHQQREDVVALLVSRFGAPQPDLLVDELVERRARAQEARPGAAGAEVAAQHREGGDHPDSLGEVVDQPLEALQPLLVVDSEDGAHDHRQGDPLGVRA
jgi:hypothetical protein